MQTFLWSLQLRAPHPSVYIRCLLQSLIVKETRVFERLSVKEFVVADLEELVLPASWLIAPMAYEVEAPHDPRFEVIRKVDAFLTQAGEVGNFLIVLLTMEL